MTSSINPTDGRLVAEYAETSPADVQRQIDEAAALQAAWEQVPLDDRAVPMLKMADLLEKNRDQLATLMAEEMSKPLAQGLAEVDKCAWVCRHYAENAERILADEAIEAGRTKSYVWELYT